MLKNIIEDFKHLEKITYKIMKYGLIFCFLICLLSIFILLTYDFSFHSPLVFYMGIGLFRMGLTFAIEFVICGFVVDAIKKQII